MEQAIGSEVWMYGDVQGQPRHDRRVHAICEAFPFFDLFIIFILSWGACLLL